MPRTWGTDGQSMQNKWLENVAQTNITCGTNGQNMCNRQTEHVKEMSTASMWIKWPQNIYCYMNNFIRYRLPKKGTWKLMSTAPELDSFALSSLFVYIYRGCQKTYTHFKKGNNCTKIVILNLHWWQSCLSHGDASIHLINAIFWANVLLQLRKVIHR